MHSVLAHRYKAKHEPDFCSRAGLIGEHTYTTTHTYTHSGHMSVAYSNPEKCLWALNTWGKSNHHRKYFHNIFNIFKNKITNKTSISFCLMSLQFPAAHVPCGKMQH